MSDMHQYSPRVSVPGISSWVEPARTSSEEQGVDAAVDLYRRSAYREHQDEDYSQLM